MSYPAQAIPKIHKKPLWTTTDPVIVDVQPPQTPYFDSDTETLLDPDGSPRFKNLKSPDVVLTGEMTTRRMITPERTPPIRQTRSATASSSSNTTDMTSDITDKMNHNNTTRQLPPKPASKRKAAAASLAIDIQPPQNTPQQTLSRKRKRTGAIMDEIEVQSHRSRESSASTTTSTLSRQSSDSFPAPPSSITPPAISPPLSSSKSNARIDRRNQAGETALHRACAAGKIDDVRELLNKGADVNAQCNAGWTPLHKACLKGWVDIVRLLCERGANPDIASTDEHDTPLHDACSNDHAEVVTVLLQAGANPRLHNSEGYFPDEMVDDDNPDLRQLVLNAKNSFKETKKENDDREDSEPPISPATKRLTRRISITSEPPSQPSGRSNRRSGNTRDDLLARDIAYRDNRSRGHLHLTAAQGDADFVNELLKMGANYKACDKEGNTPLHLAARGGHHGAVVRLLEYGDEIVNYQNKAGETPLHEVAGRGHRDTIEALMMYGADPTIRDNRGRTALDVAVELASTAAEGEIDLLKSKFVELGVELPEENSEMKESANIKVEEAEDAPRITQNGVIEHVENEESVSSQETPAPAVTTTMNDFDMPMVVAEDELPSKTKEDTESAPEPEIQPKIDVSAEPMDVIQEEIAVEASPKIKANDEAMGEVIPETTIETVDNQLPETAHPERSPSLGPVAEDRLSDHQSPDVPSPKTQNQNHTIPEITAPSVEEPPKSTVDMDVKETMQEVVPSPPIVSGPPPLWTTMASLESIPPELQGEISVYVPFYSIEYLDISGGNTAWVAHTQVCSLLGFNTEEFFEKCTFANCIQADDRL